jgi:hypothetical protein
MKIIYIIRLLTLNILVFLFTAPSVFGMGEYSKLVIPQVKYRGGEFKPRVEAIPSLMSQIANRTSIEVVREPVDIKITSSDLYRSPLIYMAGDKAFDPLSHAELKALRNYLNYGGFLFIDDSSSKKNSGFDKSVRKMLTDLFPQTPIQKISQDHSIFRSFYLISEVTGRATINPFLEGITIKGRTALVYSSNDLAGAWSKSKLGHWSYDMIGGGSKERKLSIRLGINIIMYALTLDYKKDMVHLPIILERLRRYHPK